MNHAEDIAPVRTCCTTRMMQMGLCGIYLVLGVLQPVLMSSEFTESCGYPFNASYIVFFVFAQTHLLLYSGTSNYEFKDPGGKVHQYAVLLSASIGVCFGLLFLNNFVDILGIWNSCDFSKTEFGSMIRVYYLAGISLSFFHATGAIVFAFIVRNSYEDPGWLRDSDPRNLRKVAKDLQFLRRELSREGITPRAFPLLVAEYSPNFWSWNDRLRDSTYFTYLSYALRTRVLACLKPPRLYDSRCDICQENFESPAEVLCLGIAWRNAIQFPEALHHQQREHVHPDCLQKGGITALTDPLLISQLQRVLEEHWNWMTLPQ